MSKILVLGDIHGRTIWKDITNQEFDHVVFIGDYVDTHEDISPVQQLENLADIIQFKKDNMDKAILLFGNHDFHYTSDEQYSGYQPSMRFSFFELYNTNRNLFQMCFAPNENIICSHAGITWSFLKRFNLEKSSNIIKDLNELFEFKSDSFKFYGNDPYGDDIQASPIWIRPDSLEKNGLPLIQIVGHTTQKSIKAPINNPQYWYIDTLGTSKEYLIIEDNQIKIQTLY